MSGDRFLGTPGLLGMLGMALVLAGAPCAVGAEPPASWGLAQLMAGMQQVRAATARFVERKQVRLLNQALQSSGKLSYVAPDRLQKQTLAPVPSQLTIERDRLIIVEPDGATHDMAISDYPEIAALAESIRATLAGDLVALSRYYSPTLTGSPVEWNLLLKPRGQRLRDLVSEIHIRGEGNRIGSIETVEPDGDRTVMTIVPKLE